MRRNVARTRNDENAIPAQAVRQKASFSQLSGNVKAAGSAPAPAPAKKAVATKVGAKRTALGGVVANGQKDQVMEESSKPGESIFISISYNLLTYSQDHSSRGQTAFDKPYQRW